MKALKSGLVLGVLSAVFMALPVSAYAQTSLSGGSMRISADDATYSEDVTVFTGQVDIRRGDLRILADRVSGYSSGQTGLNQSDFSRFVAEGNFYYITPEQEVRGGRGVYTKRDDTFVVTNDVILKSADGNVVTGDKLYYNLTTKNARVVGTCKGRKCGSQGRVNVLIKNSQGMGGN